MRGRGLSGIAIAGCIAAALAGGVPAQAVAARPPVVLLTLDEFPLDTLLGPDGQIDAARYPGFAALAATSAWYPNAATVYDETVKAVPAILDARLPRPGVPNTLAGHPQNAFTLFGGAGYRVVASEEASALCPERLCPGARYRRITDLLTGGRPERYARWLRRIRRGSPAFYYKHLLLPHGPRRYLPSGRELAPVYGVKGMTTPRGFFDRSLTDHNHQRFLLQLGYTDRLIGRLLARLRSQRMLDRALVVVTADHGLSFDVGVTDRRRVTDGNVDEVAPVPLFVKLPRQRQPYVGAEYLRTIDVLPTMATAVGLSVPWPHEGRPVWHPSVQERSGVRLVTRDFSRTVAIDGATLWKRRWANILHRGRLFGSGEQSRRLYGSPWASVYRSGPHPQLVGREVSSLRAGKASRAAVTLRDAWRWRSVDPRAKEVPARVAGTVGGRGRKRPRDVAVAVNGRIQATGRTFRLHRGHVELFSMLVPEEALRPGRNDVRVYQVRRGSVLAAMRGR